MTAVVTGSPWWGWAGAAMALLGIAAGLPLLIALGVLLLVITVAARWWGRHSLRDVTYRRIFRERRAFPGEELSLQMSLENRKLLPLPWVEVRDNLPEGLVPQEGRASHRPRLTVIRRSAALAWRQRASWPLVLHCGQRGHYRIGPAEVRSADLFGLYEAVAEVPRPDSVIVYPHVADLPDLRWPAARPMGERQGRERIYEDPLRIAGLRDYEPGDSLRRVDWKATARRGELQSRVYEPSAGLTLLIAVDVATMPHLWEGYMPELLERTVSAAAGVATRADADGYSFGLVANASFPDSEHRVAIAPSRAPGQLMAVLEALAVLNPFVMEPLEQMLASDARRLPYGATLAVVAATFRPALVEVLADLSARGRPVVFVLTGDEPPEDVPPRMEVVHAGPALAGPVAEFMREESRP